MQHYVVVLLVCACVPGTRCSEYEDDVQSFAQFTNVLVTQTLRTFLVLANPDVKLKARLPKGAASRQRYCTRLGRYLSVREA